MVFIYPICTKDKAGAASSPLSIIVEEIACSYTLGVCADAQESFFLVSWACLEHFADTLCANCMMMQVLNLTTYPHLMGFLDALGVETEESEMSFSLSMDDGKLEWGSHGLGTIFAQRHNLWKASFWRMIWDVIRFGRRAPEVGFGSSCGLFLHFMQQKLHSYETLNKQNVKHPQELECNFLTSRKLHSPGS